jgi:hypothetical protein
MKGKNGVFGTTERRFVNTENLKVPGPGEYDPTFPHEAKENSRVSKISIIKERTQS